MKRISPVALFATLLLPAVAAARPSPVEQLSGIIMTLILAVLITILIAPRLYRRSLEKKQGDKSLNRFLLNDPATRDIVLKSRGIKPNKPAAPGAPAANNSAPSDPPPADDK